MFLLHNGMLQHILTRFETQMSTPSQFGISSCVFDLYVFSVRENEYSQLGVRIPARAL